MNGDTAPQAERDHWSAAACAHGPASVAWGPGSGDSDAQAAMVAARLPQGSPVLDLGCGPGRIAERLKDWDVVGVDITAEMTPNGGRAEYRIGDGRHIPAGDASFAAAYSVLLFQHLGAATVRGYLGELVRVLRPGGVALIQFVEGETHVPFDHRYSLGDMLCWCCESGLSVSDLARHWFHPEWTWIEARKS